MERNHPLLYLYGDSSFTGSDEAAKVHIAYTREKHDHSEKAEGEWICKVVSAASSCFAEALTSSVQYKQLCHSPQMLQVPSFPSW
jgi:hypothetical protein